MYDEMIRKTPLTKAGKVRDSFLWMIRKNYIGQESFISSKTLTGSGSR